MAEAASENLRQLQLIEAKVIQLFALVAEGLVAATAALLDGDSALSRVLTERDEVIDAVYHDIEELVEDQLARPAPAATDVRFLLSVVRIVPELERSHDLVEHIARRCARGIRADLSPRTRGLVERMGRLGSEMWRQAACAWYDRDAETAGALARRDEEMDALYGKLVAELGSGATAVEVAMDMTLVARFYERLGDHAVNVSRRVAHLARQVGPPERPLPGGRIGVDGTVGPAHG